MLSKLRAEPVLEPSPSVLASAHHKLTSMHMEDSSFGQSSERHELRLKPLKSELGNGWLSALGDDPPGCDSCET